MKNTQEKHFEDAIEHYLLNNAYQQGDSKDFDPELSPRSHAPASLPLS